MNQLQIIGRAFVCGIFLFPGILFAQKLTDTISIPEVQVFGKKKVEEAGFTITRIDTTALKMMKTQTISDLLSSYSPVFIKSYGRGSSATASFRGTAPSHTQVYWNGLKINSPMQGDVDFSLFPVYFVDDVSLQNGGSSLQSGSGALGGSIIINNKPEWTDRLSIRYVQTIESFSTAKEHLNLGFGNGKIQLKTRLFADASKNNFPYFNYGVLPMHEAIQKNAGYHKEGMLQEIYTRFGRHSVTAKIWAYRSRRDLPQLMSFEGDNRKETQNDRNFRAVLNWKYVFGKSVLEWMGGMNSSELNYFRSSSEANFVNFDSRSKENSLISQVNFDWKPSEVLQFNWSINTTLHSVSVYDRVQKLGYDRNQSEFSLLNSLHFQPFDKLALSFVCRSDMYNQQLIGLIPSLALEYYMGHSDTESVKLNLSRNYHQPGLNDLYWLPGGNPLLKPEDGYLADLSYSYALKKEHCSFSGQVSGYASLIDNWIVWLPSANGAFYWEANNLRKVFARGTEIQLSTSFACTNGMLFNLKGNYSYSGTSNVDAVPSVDESRGKQLIYIPKHKANLFAEADFRTYYLRITAPFTGKRYTSSNNAESDYEKVLNPYWLVNLVVGKDFDWRPLKLNVSFGVENLLDMDYMAILWRPMPGRYYSLTLQFGYKK